MYEVEKHSKLCISERLKDFFHSYSWLPFVVNDNSLLYFNLIDEFSASYKRPIFMRNVFPHTDQQVSDIPKS